MKECSFSKLVIWTNINQGDIKWNIKNLDISTNEISRDLVFRNCNSGKNMAESNSSDYSSLVQSDASLQEIWQIERSGEYYKIKNATSNKYVGIRSASTNAGADIVITPDRGQADIVWEIKKVSPHGLKFKNRQSGLFIGVQSASTITGAKLVQWRDENQKDIIWQLDYPLY